MSPREARERAGLSQAVVAHQLGVVRHAVAMWEARGVVPADKLAEFARIVGAPELCEDHPIYRTALQLRAQARSQSRREVMV